MARKKKELPPSKIKYDKNHPPVSARLPKDKRDKLLKISESRDATLAQLLLHFIGEYEIKDIPIEEAKKAGFEEAKKIYMVPFVCNVCGKPLAITGSRAKEVAGKYMTEHGWGHAECHKKKSPEKKQ